MRKLLLAGIAAFSLSGCATLNPDGTKPTPADLIAAVQAYTQQVCGFLPIASGVGALITQFYPAGVPLLEAAQAIGAAICAGPTTTVAGRLRIGSKVTRLVRTPRGSVRVSGIVVSRKAIPGRRI